MLDRSIRMFHLIEIVLVDIRAGPVDTGMEVNIHCEGVGLLLRVDGLSIHKLGGCQISMRLPVYF